MTTAAENETLTRVGPGTPMGNLMRQYWIPAALSSELQADGDPLRLMLLGEKLVAFRDSGGQVGVFDHRCPHRRASLFFGRNEQGGIRCVYHGWKFDVTGRCLETLNVAVPEFKDRIRARAYRTAERGGVVYVFMGDAAELPPLPDIESTLVAEEDLEIQFVLRECNWLQGVEGELDTSHVGIMHFGAVDRSKFTAEQHTRYVVANRAPEYRIEETGYGHIYGAYREADEGRMYWRLGQFLMPFWTMPPINPIATNVLTRAYVPLDDTHTMVVALVKKGAYPQGRSRQTAEAPGATQNYDTLPNSTDWLGRWRMRPNARNDYEIDREDQRTRSYTGIDGVQLQDQAIQESMGEMSDRESEHLAPSDIMVTRVRRQLLEAVRRYAEDGELPPTARQPELYRRVRGGHFVAPEEADWREVYARSVAASPWESVGKSGEAG